MDVLEPKYYAAIGYGDDVNSRNIPILDGECFSTKSLTKKLTSADKKLTSCQQGVKFLSTSY